MSTLGDPAWLISRSAASELLSRATLGPFKLGPIAESGDVWTYIDDERATLWRQGLVCRVRPQGSANLRELDLLARRSANWLSVATTSLAPGSTADPATWSAAAIAQLAQFGATGSLAPWLSLVRTCRTRPILAGIRPVATLEISLAWPAPRNLAAPLGRPLRVARVVGLAGATPFDSRRLVAVFEEIQLAPAGPEVPPAALGILSATGSAPRSRTWRSLAPRRLARLVQDPASAGVAAWAQELFAAAGMDLGSLPALRTAAALWRKHGEPAPGPAPDDLVVATLTSSLADPLRAMSALERSEPDVGVLGLALRAALALHAANPASSPGAEARAWVSLLLGRPWQGGWLAADRVSQAPAAVPTRHERASRAAAGADGGFGGRGREPRSDGSDAATGVPESWTLAALLSRECKAQARALEVGRRILAERSKLVTGRAGKPATGRTGKRGCQDAAGGDPDDAEVIHDLRVAARRLALALEVAEVPSARRARRLVRKLGRRLGSLRDADVAIDTAVDLASRLEPRVRARLAPFVAELVAARQAAGRSARPALGRKLYRAVDAAVRQVRRELGRQVGDPPRTPRREAWNEVARLLARFAAAVRNPALEQGDPRELHALRLAIKRLRYAVAIVEPLLGRPARRADRELGRLQTSLGHHHDLWNLLRRMAASPAAGSEALESLLRAARAEIDALAGELPGLVAPVRQRDWVKGLVDSAFRVVGPFSG